MSELLKLLPHSLKYDPFLVACAEAFEIQMNQIHEEFQEASTLHNIPTINEQLIDFLAHDRHVDYYHDVSAQEKKNLVQKSVSLHAKKGTKAGLLKVFEMLNLNGKISEWFEYDGDPGKFRIDILELVNKGIDENMMSKLDDLINAYKRETAHIETINVYLTNRHKPRYAAITQSSEVVTVYPFRPKDVEMDNSLKIATAILMHETTTIYPRRI